MILSETSRMPLRLVNGCLAKVAIQTHIQQLYHLRTPIKIRGVLVLASRIEEDGQAHHQAKALLILCMVYFVGVGGFCT